MIFKHSDIRTHPDYGQIVNLTIRDENLTGRFMPANINLKHDRIQAGDMQVIIDKPYFDTDDGIMCIGESSAEVEWFA